MGSRRGHRRRTTQLPEANNEITESKIMNLLDQWEQAFDDWVVLLERADAKDLLLDPKAIWDEAWRQAIILSKEMQNGHH